MAVSLSNVLMEVLSTYKSHWKSIFESSSGLLSRNYQLSMIGMLRSRKMIEGISSVLLEQFSR
jgi:hypothetical protein